MFYVSVVLLLIRLGTTEGWHHFINTVIPLHFISYFITSSPLRGPTVAPRCVAVVHAPNRQFIMNPRRAERVVSRRPDLSDHPLLKITPLKTRCGVRLDVPPQRSRHVHTVHVRRRGTEGVSDAWGDAI